MLAWAAGFWCNKKYFPPPPPPLQEPTLAEQDVDCIQVAIAAHYCAFNGLADKRGIYRRSCVRRGCAGQLRSGNAYDATKKTQFARRTVQVLCAIDICFETSRRGRYRRFQRIIGLLVCSQFNTR